MKRSRIVFVAGAAMLFAATAFGLNPLPEDSMDAVKENVLCCL